LSWIHFFELMCYAIVVLMLADCVRKKDWDALYTFGTAALVGFIMELMAVAATDIYHYNPEFWLNLGRQPNQFPVFGGFMWGGLTVYGIRLAKRLRFGTVMTCLTAGMLIVTMDLLLDVAAIRLDGGFWVWEGRAINLSVDTHLFMSVIWVNFLGYMIETPAVTYLTLQKERKVHSEDVKGQLLSMILIAVLAVIVTSLGSLIALGLNKLTNDWFSCLAFVLLWIVLAALILRRLWVLRMPVRRVRDWDLPLLIFWLCMYGYCLAALVHLDIHTARPLYFAAGILFCLVTVYLCLADNKEHLHITHEVRRDSHPVTEEE